MYTPHDMFSHRYVSLPSVQREGHQCGCCVHQWGTAHGHPPTLRISPQGIDDSRSGASQVRA